MALTLRFTSSVAVALRLGYDGEGFGKRRVGTRLDCSRSQAVGT